MTRNDVRVMLVDHPSNEHTWGHFYMLTGRSVNSPVFTGERKPRSTDWPSIASVIGDALPPRNDKTLERYGHNSFGWSLLMAFWRLRERLLSPNDRALAALLDDLHETGLLKRTVIGATGKCGAFPVDSPQKPENMAGTTYHALGIPKTAAWHDELDRPQHLDHGNPIPGLI